MCVRIAINIEIRHGPPFEDTLMHQVATQGSTPRIELTEQLNRALTQGDFFQDFWLITTAGGALEAGISSQSMGVYGGTGKSFCIPHHRFNNW